MCVVPLMLWEVCLRLGFLLSENHSYFVSGWVSKKAPKKRKIEDGVTFWLEVGEIQTQALCVMKTICFYYKLERITQDLTLVQ